MSVDLLTTAQAAGVLGIDASSVRHYVHSGRLPATKVGRDWLIKAADLACLERRAYRRTQEAGQDGQSLSIPGGILGTKEDAS